MTWWRRLDIPFLLVVPVLAFLGLLMIYSATDRQAGPGSLLSRQMTYLWAGLFLFALFTAVDYEFWGKHHWLLYGLGLALLGAVLVPGVGETARGAARWLSLGPLGSFQPSEPVKLVVAVSLARLLAGPVDRTEPSGGLPFFKALLCALVPAVLIALQPDLGTALVLGALWLTAVYLAGAPAAWISGMVAAALVAFPLLLRDYQRDRLLVFFHPESDPAGAGWNLIQARIAVGSGQVWGKGLFEGTQNRLHFVPEHHTDFIFTVVAEELGLVGGLAILALFGYLLIQGMRTAGRARDRFGALLAAGIVSLWASQVVVNVGMTLGVMPITGLPLPFLSYGGSSLVTNFMAAGILNSIWSRRPER